MPVAVRIIPTLLNRRGSLVKGQRFSNARVIGHIRQAVRVFQSRNVDELIVLDIAATLDSRRPDFALVRDLATECFMPLTVGGGVRSVEDIRALLANGADKVAINSAAFEVPDLIEHAASRFGSQAIVVSIDAHSDNDPAHDPARAHSVRYRAGSVDGGVGAVGLARRMVDAGAGEILLTSIDRDGTLAGYDLDLIHEVSSVVDVPVIAAGGCGEYKHMVDALHAGAHAVASGAMWHFTDATPRAAAHYLREHGINARTAA